MSFYTDNDADFATKNNSEFATKQTPSIGTPTGNDFSDADETNIADPDGLVATPVGLLLLFTHDVAQEAEPDWQDSDGDSIGSVTQPTWQEDAPDSLGSRTEPDWFDEDDPGFYE